MGIERTLIILKQDALEQGIEFEILDRFRKEGFSIVDLCKTIATRELLLKFYAEAIKKHGDAVEDVYIKSMESGPLITAVIEGENAIKKVRLMCGEDSEPIKCAPRTIRHDYSTDSYKLANLEGRNIKNIIHSSDSEESAKMEIDLLFNKYSRGIIKMEKTDAFEEIAAIIDYTLPDLICELVGESNEKGMLYHGIKKSKNVDKIRREGLKPLTPESGPCSLWSTGIALFCPPDDSPFFRYSGSYSKDHPDICELNLAMSSHTLLSKIDLHLAPYEKDSQVGINEVVPYEAIAILNVKVKHPLSDSHEVLRKYRQAAEQMLLMAVDAQIHGAFSPRKVVKYFKEVKL